MVIERTPISEQQEATRLRRMLGDFRLPIDIVVVSDAFAERYADIPGTVVYPALREGKVLHG